MSPPRTPTSLTLHFLRLLKDQDNLHLPTSSFPFWDLRPLWFRPHQSKPAQFTHTSLPAAGATAVHQTGVRYTLCSFYGYCWCLTFTHTSAQQCALYLLIWVFTQAAETERVRTLSLTYKHFVHDLTVEPRPTTTHLLHHNIFFRKSPDGEGVGAVARAEIDGDDNFFGRGLQVWGSKYGGNVQA